MPVNFRVKTDADKNDLTAPYNELEAFSSLWDALRWRHIRKRVLICFKKSLYNRYMLANVIYLGYSIVVLVIDFHPAFNSEPSTDTNSTTGTCSQTTPTLDEPVFRNESVNRIYIGLAVVNLIIAFLYLIAWRGQSWLAVVIIPAYLNPVQPGLFIWSSLWYSKLDTLGGYYTMTVHRIELTASCIEVIAAAGWMFSWYRTYTRTLGRGFTLDDPDTMAYLTTISNTFVYLVYNIKMNVYPEEYSTSDLYTYGDILGFIGSIYYILGTLRDDNWFWFLPLAGQYGIAIGRIHIDTRTLPKFGKPEILITDLCRRRKYDNNHVNTDFVISCL